VEAVFSAVRYFLHAASECVPPLTRTTGLVGIAVPRREGYPLDLVAVSLTVAAYTMRLSASTLYVND